MTATAEQTRSASLLAEALCTCSQSRGRHARGCVTAYLNAPGGRRRLSYALAAHDTRRLAAATDPCTSCERPVDPDNLCRVNGLTYHLGNCPRPHGDFRP